MTHEVPAILMRHLLTAGLQAAVLAVLVGLALLVVGRGIAPRWRHRLWWLVVLRLALPVLPASAISIYQWLPDAFATPRTATDTPTQNKSVADNSTGPTATPSPPGRSLEEPAYSPDPAATEPAPEATGQTGLAPPIRPSPASAAPVTAEDAEGLTGPTPTVAEEPSTTAASPRGAIHRFAPAAFIVWLAVAALLLTRTTIGWMVLTRRVRRDATQPAPRTARLLDEEAQQLRLKRPPALRTTSAVPGPALIGAFRPTLLLPPGLAEVLDEPALRLVFRHELCHLRSRDNLANWLLAFLQSVHWFNPVAWWALAQLRTQREHARDADTLRSRPKEQHIDRTRTYANALLAVVRFGVGHSPQAPRPHPAASAAVRDRRHLSRRLAMLEHANRFRLRHTLLASALLSVFAVTGLTVAQGQAANPQDLPDQAENTQPPQTGSLEAAQAEPAEVAPEHAEDGAARAARTIISAFWEEASFDMVIADLERQAGLRITLDPAIEDAIDALDPRPNISLQFARIPIEQALQLVMERLFGNRLREALPPVEHHYTLEEGVLHFGLAKVDLQFYDVRDLIAPDQVDMTQAPWTDEEREAERQRYIQELRGLIHDTVGRPGHWDGRWDEAGYGGSVREHEGRLAIRTTPQNHWAILGLLTQLRATRGLQISYETQLLLLDSQTFVEVFSQDISILTQGEEGFRGVHPQRLYGGRFLEHEDGSREPLPDKTPAGFSGLAMISQAQRVALAQRLESSERNDFALDIPRLTDINGRQPWVLIAQHLSYISALESAGDSDPPEPTLSTTEAGMLLLIEGTVSADRDFVTMRIELEAAAIAGMPLVLPHEGDLANGFTEIPQIDRATMGSTLSMPKDEWLILIGPLIQGKIHDDPAEYTDTRRVVLLVKPTIIELQEQEIDMEELEALRERSEAAGPDEPAVEGDPLGD